MKQDDKNPPGAPVGHPPGHSQPLPSASVHGTGGHTSSGQGTPLAHGAHPTPVIHQEDPPEKEQSLKQAFQNAPAGLRNWSIGLLVGAVILVVGVGTFRANQVRQEAAEREAEIKAGPLVKIATVKMSSGSRTVNLVGEAKPFAAVTLYAKVSGYLRAVKVDKGDRVKKGQILASIDSPETGTSLEGLNADAKNKAMIAQRMMELKKKNLASAQEAEQAESDAAVAKSRFDTVTVQAGEQFLRAPFDGTVTARYADPGALVQSAMNSQTSSLPVVSISQTTQLRVYVYVDQRDASFISAGVPVEIRLTERPDAAPIQAKVTRISGELDAQTRMLLTEIDVDNQDGALIAGSFVQVALNLKTPSFLEIPAEALVPGKTNSTVPVVGEGDILHYTEIRVASVDGKLVQVVSGLKEGDRVALNIGSSIDDGSKVRPVAPPTKAGGAKTAERSIEKPAEKPVENNVQAIPQKAGDKHTETTAEKQAVSK